MRSLFLLLLLTLAIPFSAFAYTDQITVKADEAWAAVLRVFENQKLRKMDPQKMFLQTKWVEDEVVRRGPGILKNYTSQTYDRRYRLSIQVVQREYDTEIQIKGSFQQRTMSPNNVVSWKRVKPKTEDFDIERATFMRILSRIELTRNSQ